MTREREYTHILSTLAAVSCPNQTLTLIKAQFCEGIDSARRMDRVNNISRLIGILEKRDILNIDDISPLRCIAAILHMEELIRIIDTYGKEPIREPTPVIPVHPTARVIPAIDPDPVEKVYDLICREIGHKWKDLARALKMPEGQIDDLEVTYKRMQEIVRKVLVYHRENSDSRYWRVNLCNALVTARRKDLSLQVQEVFAMHNLM